eukprot:scaffold421323_cov47-Attheya_sp.AAC.1
MSENTPLTRRQLDVRLNQPNATCLDTKPAARGTEDDESPMLLNKVPFARMLKSRDMENLKLELLHRGLSTEGTWITCRNHLMHHEGDRQSFQILSSATFP